MGSLFGLLSGLCFGMTSVGGKLASKGGATPAQTTLMSLLVGTPFFGLLLLLPGQWPDPAAVWNWRALLYFALAGLTASVLARILYFHAVNLVGPGRVNQLVATDTLFSLAMAWLLLGEWPTGLHLAGIALIMASVFVISTDRRRAAQAASPRWYLRGVAYGLGAGLLYGLRNIFTRMGLEVVPFSLWGAFVGCAASLIAYLAYLWGTGQLAATLPRRTGRGLPWMLTVSLAYCGAWYFMYSALEGGQVALVTALKNTSPFWSILLANLLIGREEAITPRILISASALFLGVVLSL